MPNPLDPIDAAFSDAKHALVIVRRCSGWTTVNAVPIFRYTPFQDATHDEVERRIEEARGELADLAVVALYAAFERTLRDHAAQFSSLLAAAAPPSKLGSALPSYFAESINWAKMDEIERWFSPPVTIATRDRVATVRVYRHWVAHGRDPNDPPSALKPKAAYKILSQFLREAGLI